MVRRRGLADVVSAAAARRAAVSVLVLLLAVGLAACGSDSGAAAKQPSESPGSASASSSPSPTSSPTGDPATLLAAAIAGLKAQGGADFVQSAIDSSTSSVPLRDLQGGFTIAPEAMDALSTVTDPETGEQQLARIRNLAGVGYVQLPSWSAPADKCWLRLDPTVRLSTIGVDPDSTGRLPPALTMLSGAVGSGFLDQQTILGTVQLYYLIQMAPASVKPKLAALTPYTAVAASFAVKDGRLSEVTIQGVDVAKALAASLDAATLSVVEDIDYTISFTPRKPSPITAPAVTEQMTSADLAANRCPVG